MKAFIQTTIKNQCDFSLLLSSRLLFFGTQGMELLSRGDVESFGFTSQLHESSSIINHIFLAFVATFCNHLKSSTNNVSPSSIQTVCAKFIHSFIHPSIHTTALPERTMASKFNWPVLNNYSISKIPCPN